MLQCNTSSCRIQGKELQGEYISPQQYILYHVRRHTLALRSDPNALWHPSKNPGGEAHAQGIRLGPVERALLQFIHKHMNDSGDPLFSKQTYIARCLGTTRSSLNRAMGSLESKGLIWRIHMNWSHRIRTILVPMGFHGQYHLDNFAPIPQSCRILIRILSDFNDLNHGVISYNSIRVKKTLPSRTQEESRTLRVGHRWQDLLRSRSEQMKLQRDLINPKTVIKVLNDIEDPLIPFDRSLFQRRTAITPDHYGLSLSRSFRQPREGRKLDTYDRWEARIKEMLVKLCADGVFPAYEDTRAVINSWRKRIPIIKQRKIPTDEAHPEWCKLLVIITYRKRYNGGIDLEVLRDAISRLAAWGGYKYRWSKAKKWPIIGFFLDIDNRWLKYFFDEEEIAFKNYIFEKKPQFVVARQNFEDTFMMVLNTHDDDQLMFFLFKYKNLVTQFVDQMTIVYKSPERITYGLPIFLGGIRSIIGKYLRWLDENIWENGRIRMLDLPNYEYWKAFIVFFRTEYDEYPDLWRVKEKRDED